MEDPIDQYLNFIIKICPLLTPKEIAEHRKKICVKYLEKKETFLTAGMLQTNVGFLTSGLIRVLGITYNGNEITQGFLSENQFVSHYSALLSSQPSRFTYQCLENCTIVVVPYSSILEAYNFSHQFERFGRIIAEKTCQAHHHRVESFLFETAEERYQNFLASSPDLFKRVTITHLSSYLGIKRQTLTRIRKKAAKTIVKLNIQ